MPTQTQRRRTSNTSRRSTNRSSGRRSGSRGTRTQNKQSPLTKKMGPFPMWLWLMGFAALCYLYYQRYTGGSTSGNGTQQGQYSPRPYPQYTGPSGDIPIIITPTTGPGHKRHRRKHHHHHKKVPHGHSHHPHHPGHKHEPHGQPPKHRKR